MTVYRPKLHDGDGRLSATLTIDKYFLVDSKKFLNDDFSRFHKLNDLRTFGFWKR